MPQASSQNISLSKDHPKENDPASKTTIHSELSKTVDTNLKERKIATRLAFGQELLILGEQNSNLVVLDAETANSTYLNLFAEKFPERFLQSFIAEQNMVSVATGLSLLGKVPVLATFGAFLTRAFDQIRMSQYSLPKVNLNIVGTHAGVSIGEDGPSQMALEDLAMFRTLRGSVVLYPSDAKSTQVLLKLMITNSGLKYLRLTRNETPLLYLEQEEFVLGGSKILRSSNLDLVCLSQQEVMLNWLQTKARESQTIANLLTKALTKQENKQEKDLSFNSNTNSQRLENCLVDDITIVSAGITLFEALKAWEILVQANISSRIIDLYSVKPLDKNTLLQASYQSKAILVVEDHYPEGGLFSAVLEALANAPIWFYNRHWLGIFSLAVNKIPRSGHLQDLFQDQEIDAQAIVKKVREILGK